MEPRRTSLPAQLLKNLLSGSFILLGLIEGVVGIAAVADMPAFPGPLQRSWGDVAGFALLGFTALTATIIAAWRPRLAGFLFMGAAPIMTACFSWSRTSRSDPGVSADLGLLAVTSLSFIVPGIFWLATSRGGWPAAVPTFLTRKPLRLVLAGASVFLLCLVGSMFLSLYLPVSQRADCHGLPPIVAPQTPDQVVLTGKVVARMHMPSRVRRVFESWSVLRVERRFWGLPWWTSFAIYRAGLPPQYGDNYFVDGRRSQGLLMHFLPVFEYDYCTRTCPVSWGVTDLRVLEDGPPKFGVRIIGRVYTENMVEAKPAPNVKLWITGPNGTSSTSSDGQGIYDLTGLPVGHYSIHLDSAYDLRHGRAREADLKSGEIWGPILTATLVKDGVYQSAPE